MKKEKIEEKLEVIEEKEIEKDVVVKVLKPKREMTFEESSWSPKTELGRKVKSGEIKDLDYVIKNNFKILEPEIVDKLISVEYDLLSIGQAKGKFGGGKRRAWRQTQRKTKEGNILSFSAMAIVGNKNGYVGIGSGKAKETLPAREKAVRRAKLNIIKVTRGCGSFDCNCKEAHTIPFKVKGDEGSVRIELMPAPQGTGLVINDQCKKILIHAGIKDIYSRTSGKVRTTFNLAKACVNALEKTNKNARGDSK